MLKKPSRNSLRKVRHRRVRGKIAGTAARPRLNVYRSEKHIYAQLIDDEAGHTLAAASSRDESLKNVSGANREGAKAVGALIAKRAQEKGIKSVVFDRGGYLYHGRVAALAEGARENGLEF